MGHKAQSQHPPTEQITACGPGSAPARRARSRNMLQRLHSERVATRQGLLRGSTGKVASVATRDSH
eukprot:5156327-Alexandrium_andersonii.AAC.1